VMMLVRLPDASDAFHRGLIADMAAQRVTGVRRVHDDSALAQDFHRLLYETWLRIFGMYFEKTTGHSCVGGLLTKPTELNGCNNRRFLRSYPQMPRPQPAAMIPAPPALPPH